MKQTHSDNIKIVIDGIFEQAHKEAEAFHAALPTSMATLADAMKCVATELEGISKRQAEVRERVKGGRVRPYFRNNGRADPSVRSIFPQEPS